jgi:hypothetical protein
MAGSSRMLSDDETQRYIDGDTDAHRRIVAMV